MRVAVGGDDAGALLAAVLEGVETEIREVGGLGMPEDPEDTALVLELVEHGMVCAGRRARPSRRSILRCPSSRRVGRNVSPSAVDQPASASSSAQSSAPAPRQRQSGCGSARSCRSPPPARACSAASCSSAAIAPGRTLTTTRDADSPNSVAATAGCVRRSACDAAGTSTSRPMPAVSNAHSAERHGQAAVRTIVRGSAAGRVPPPSVSRSISARSRWRSSAGGAPAHEAVNGLQVLAAAQLAEAVAEQHDRVAAAT